MISFVEQFNHIKKVCQDILIDFSERSKPVNRTRIQWRMERLGLSDTKALSDSTDYVNQRHLSDFKLKLRTLILNSLSDGSHTHNMLPLPHEIERTIFRLAAGVHPANDVHSYLLVAPRVRDWIEKSMYHTVVLASEARACLFVDSLRSRRPVFASVNVKSLCVRGTVKLATAAEVIQLCSGIVDLALWILPEGDHAVPDCLLDATNKLPLSRLSIRLSTVFHRTDMPFLPSISLFSKITHLDLLEGWVLWGSPIGIHCLTQLTHISLRLFTDRTAPALLQMILTHCTLLQVLILRVTEEVGRVEKWLQAHDGLNDHRIVVTAKSTCDTWDCRVASDGMSLWQYGDDYITKFRNAIQDCTD